MIILREPLILWPVRFQGRHIALIFAIACFGVMPFAFSGKLLDPARYPQMVVLCLGMAALLLPLAKPKVGQSDAPSAAVSKVSVLMLALALWTGSSMFWALNKAEAWFALLQLSLGFTFFHLSRKAIQQLPNLLETVVKTLIVSMGLLAMIGLLQRIGIDPLGLSDKLFTPNATMTNPN
ncbi:MAG: hypothetical protein RLZZ519_3240, partial [Bacteroidota bacterium]